MQGHTMKIIFLATIFLLTINVHATTYNETFKHTDTIYKIGAINTRSDADFILLNNFTSAGSCPKSEGLVVARFPSGDSGDRSFSIALSAKMNGKSVLLAVDDGFKNNNGYCYVKSLLIVD